MSTYLFVYGTLKKGFHNNRLLADQEFISEARTSMSYIMESRGIPYVYERCKAWQNGILVEGDQITGELYRVNDEALPAIDQLEGHPRWYRRKKVDILPPFGTNKFCKISAWLYFMQINQTLRGYPVISNESKITACYG